LNDPAEEPAATKAKGKQNKVTQKNIAPSVPGDGPPDPDPAPLDGVAETPRRPDTAPAKSRSLPRDRDAYTTPQPKEVRHTKAYRGKAYNEVQQAAELQQLPDPSSDDLDPATKPDGVNAIPLKATVNGPNPPEKEVIDLTTKEESPPATPIPPAQLPESNEGSAELKAGWVCSSESFEPCAH
jgi:hypothetical protein